MSDYLHWLKSEARNELTQEEWYNLIAQYVLGDEETLIEMTPKEAGWENF